MDIFKNTCDHDSVENLELERFKAKIREIWARLLEECFAKYPTEGMDLEHFKEHNALHFADEPQPEDEIDNLMEILDELMDSKEELDPVESEGKAPTYNGKQIGSHNESRKIEKTDYEYNHKTTKTPSESRSGGKGGSYVGTPSGRIGKKKDDKVIRSFSPIAEKLKEELIALKTRQNIGKRRQLFR